METHLQEMMWNLLFLLLCHSNLVCSGLGVTSKCTCIYVDIYIYILKLSDAFWGYACQNPGSMNVADIVSHSSVVNNNNNNILY